MSAKPEKKTHHGGVPEEQPGNHKEALSDGTTGGEGGGPGLGYGGHAHAEKPQTIRDQSRPGTKR